MIMPTTNGATLAGSGAMPVGFVNKKHANVRQVSNGFIVSMNNKTDYGQTETYAADETALVSIVSDYFKE